MGFHHVGQAGLKLLTSGYPSVSDSQTAGIDFVFYQFGLYFILYKDCIGLAIRQGFVVLFLYTYHVIIIVRVNA